MSETDPKHSILISCGKCYQKCKLKVSEDTDEASKARDWAGEGFLADLATELTSWRLGIRWWRLWGQGGIDISEINLAKQISRALWLIVAVEKIISDLLASSGSSCTGPCTWWAFNIYLLIDLGETAEARKVCGLIIQEDLIAKVSWSIFLCQVRRQKVKQTMCPKLRDVTEILCAHACVCVNYNMEQF